MTPSARVQAAIELLDDIIAGARNKGASADKIAANFFAGRRYAGSKDRRAIRDLTWNAIRCFGDCPENGRAAFVALARNDPLLLELFNGGGYGPASITVDEPSAVGGAIPEWIEPLFSELIPSDEKMALLDRAPLDIRVNRLLSTREAVMEELPEAELLDAAPLGLRLPTGFALDHHPLLKNGHVEIQDLGSQLISLVCEAKADMTVLDFCAGAGGKTLALAADMNGKGRLIASDTNRDRLSQLRPRAERAGSNFIETRLLNPGKEQAALHEFEGQCDIVLVDAPCSGSGTWRRNPETRWRLDEKELLRLVNEQARILDLASQYLRQGGHMVYAVCSLFAVEGVRQMERFLDRNKGWEPTELGMKAGRTDGAGNILSPAHDGSDGFYVARLQRL
jgi:16S rRNA (cytosine967-C5)-methyltransferase